MATVGMTLPKVVAHGPVPSMSTDSLQRSPQTRLHRAPQIACTHRDYTLPRGSLGKTKSLHHAARHCAPPEPHQAPCQVCRVGQRRCIQWRFQGCFQAKALGQATTVCEPYQEDLIQDASRHGSLSQLQNFQRVDKQKVHPSLRSFLSGLCPVYAA